MATLQKIRNRAGLLVVVIGVAMLAFILTDLLNSSGSLFQSGNSLGSIDGETVNRIEFERELESVIAAKYPNGNVTEENRVQERDALWNQKVREAVLNDHYEMAGVRVSKDELTDLMTGNRTGDLDPITKQLFGIDESTQFTPEMMAQTIQQVLENDPRRAATYVYFEEMIRKNRFNTKYFNLIKRGLQATGQQAMDKFIYENKSLNGRFIQMPFTTMADSLVSVSESELKSYYNENKEEYKQTESRNLEFVVFNVEPSAEDRAAAFEEMNDLLNDRVEYNRSTGEYDTIPGFRNAENDSTFIAAYGDVDAPFNPTYFKPGGGLIPRLDTVMFDVEVGHIVGPYVEDGNLRVAKLSGITMRPDSVKARHILVAVEENDYASAKVIADSLKELVDNGADFAELATANSDDPGSAAKGGDLGWFEEGQMVPTFNDASFSNEVGDIVMVPSQFGYHIIEILDQGGISKAVRVAVLSRAITPSNATADQVYQNASTFAVRNKNIESMRSAADSLGLAIRQAANLQPNQRQVSGLGNYREIVRWAYAEDSEEGATRMFDLTDKLVVVGLAKKNEEGYKPLDEVRAQVELAVRNEKKAEKFMEEVNSAMTEGVSLDDLAASLGQTVKPVTAVKFSTGSVPGAGFEPALVGAMFGTPVGSLAGPIKGNNGVYVYQIDSANEAPANPNLLTQKVTIENQLRSRTEFQMYSAMEDKADIEDKRSEIY